MFFFLFPNKEGGIRSVRWFALAIAVTHSMSTVFLYIVDRRAHASDPWNPSFYFSVLNRNF
jgi:hypothetical protein